WDYVPSEFAAYLQELRQIRRYRPHFNHRGNLTRRSILIKISNHAAPRIYTGASGTPEDAGCYGPFRSRARTDAALRTLNGFLRLPDCPAHMPILFAGQGDLFDQPRQAGCMRHQFGFCSGPCAGFVTERDYRLRVETAAAFLEGRTLQPLDRVVRAMQEAADAGRFELAARWRGRFEPLECVVAATSRGRN